MKFRVNSYVWLLLLLLLAFVFVFSIYGHVLEWVLEPQTVSATETVNDPMEVETAGNCRYGLTAYGSQRDRLDEFGSGWFIDFGVSNPMQPGFAEYVPIIHVNENKDGLGNYLGTYTVSPPLTNEPGGLGWSIAQRPSSIWIIGNEPDRGPNADGTPGQGDMHPHVYARAYHDIYNFIKKRDASALVANAGLVEVTPLRLQYLDKVWNAYWSLYGTGMPVDVWNMHLYILPETELNDGSPNGTANVPVGTLEQDWVLGKRGPGNVRSQCCWDRECDKCGLGQSRRRRHATRHAAYLCRIRDLAGF